MNGIESKLGREGHQIGPSAFPVGVGGRAGAQRCVRGVT